MTTETLHELKAAWLAAEEAETEANTSRLAIEQQMLALLPTQDEGTATDKDTGISVTYKITRSVDTSAIQRDWQKLSAAAQGVLRWKADLDTRAYRALSEHDPIATSVLAHYITSKPAKPTISVKKD